MVINVQKFCEIQGLIFILSKKLFWELLSYANLEPNPILIIAVANSHYKETDIRKMPIHDLFYVLMLLFQELPYMLLPFYNTNMNLYLGKMIRNMDYGLSTTAKEPFSDFMKKTWIKSLHPFRAHTVGILYSASYSCCAFTSPLEQQLPVAPRISQIVTNHTPVLYLRLANVTIRCYLKNNTSNTSSKLTYRLYLAAPWQIFVYPIYHRVYYLHWSSFNRICH